MHTTDDRGQRVRLIPQRQLGILPGLPSPIPMKARERIWGDMQEHQFSRSVILPSILALIAIVIVAILWSKLAPTLLAPLGLSPITQGIVMGSWPFLAMPPFIWILTRANRQRIVRCVVKHGHCASCGYSLATLIPAEDRCTLCPECGSAWRVGSPGA
jgi:hypothetical protein